MTQSKARSKLWDGINGATGVQVPAVGGTLGTANVQFTANPTEADTLTVNGNIFVFTATPTTGLHIEILGTLALTLADAETVIEAYAALDVVVANVDVTDTNTDLSFQFLPNVTGVVATSTNGANTTDDAYVAGTACPSINISTGAVFFEIGSPGAIGYYVLPNGTQDGQSVELYVVSSGDSSDLGIKGAFASSNNLGTLGGAAADGAVVYWDKTNSIWKSTKATNMTYSAFTAGVL